MRIAVIASGVSGLVCAHLLRRHHDVTLFEAEPRAGDHAHTVTARIDGIKHAIDTGFIVYNGRNYPLLTRLFAELGVMTRPGETSFAVADDDDARAVPRGGSTTWWRCAIRTTVT
jgi:predicted NAD/FAD-binding protein